MKRLLHTWRGSLPGLVAVLLSWGTFFLILWPKMLYRTGEGIMAGWMNVWGDWAAHMSFASVFAYRDPSDWLISHPLYKGVKFTYPFLADAISGLLIRGGFDTIAAFIVPSIFCTLALLVVLYAFYYTMLRSSRQATLALTLNFLSGGLGFMWFLRDLASSPTLATLMFPPKEYTHMEEHGIAWITLISSQLVPQRAFLLGLLLVLVLMLVLHKLVTTKKVVDDTTFVAFGFISSLMLFVHVHAFIAFVFFCSAYALVYHKKWKSWFVFALSAAITSSLIFSALYGGEIHSGFFKLYPGWMANPTSLHMNWLYFWWLNWGWFLPFSLFATLKTKFYKHPLFIGAAAIFAASNLVLFQPFDWDNSKLLSFVYLVLCIPVVQYSAVLWRKKNILARGFVAVSIFIMCFSGALDVVRMLNTTKGSNMLWNNEEIALAQEFRKISRPTDTVLVSDQHNSWVSNLTGRQILLGYRGWMWTYGIDYGEREKDVLAMFKGGDEAQMLLSKYGVRFVVVGPYERGAFTANEEFFKATYPVVMHSEQYTVYKVF